MVNIRTDIINKKTINLTTHCKVKLKVQRMIKALFRLAHKPPANEIVSQFYISAPSLHVYYCIFAIS